MYTTGFFIKRRQVSHCLITFLLALPLWGVDPDVLRAKSGIVTSRSMIASEVGINIMKRGGNAVDAAVATAFALAVTYPSAGNIGGGGFMLIRLADGTIAVNDHREVAPQKATRDMYLGADGEPVRELSRSTHLAVGVPGSVAGLLDALEKYGNLPREAVLEPAIRLAREGFRLPDDIALQIKGRLADLSRFPAGRDLFQKSDGNAYVASDVFIQANLARTLKRISELGTAGFYKGVTAELLVAEMERHGGLITLEDLKNYRSIWREPIRGTYRGYEIASMPPPSSGGILLVMMLNMLEQFDLRAMGSGSPALIHHVVEAERRAYADRAQHLGDSDFYPVPIATLVSKEYARFRFQDFQPSKASPSESIEAGQIPFESLETTHLSTMDAQGNAVALTTTLNGGYGARIVVEGAGFLLNNEMDDFSAKPNTMNMYQLLGREANSIAPGKRMLSSMTPTIVSKEGEVVLVTGSPGGSTIITTVLQVVSNVIDHGMGLSDAVAHPRFHHQWLPDSILVEKKGFSSDVIRVLQEMGHRKPRVMTYGRGIGDANSIMRVDDELRGVSDPRNIGGAAGY